MHRQADQPTFLWALPRSDYASVPQRVRVAILGAVREERDYAAACRLFADDVVGRPSRDDARRARLEHAVARGILDAWGRGLATPRDVGCAYADLAFRLRVGDVRD